MSNETAKHNDQPASERSCLDPAGSHSRVIAELKSWLKEDAISLCFGTDKEKAESWRKCAIRLEKLAMNLENEITSANVKDSQENRSDG